MRRSAFPVLALAMVLLLAACSSGPRELHFGAEACAHCRMVISDERYAAQLLTAQGRSLAFDDLACMAAFLRGDGDAGAAEGGQLRGAWVADFDAPGDWIAVDDAWLVRSPSLRTPMGGGLAAVATEPAARALQQEVGGTVLRWAAVLDAQVAEGHGHDHH